MSSDKELAYRYDLFIAPDWGERFDSLIDESIELPTEGRVLEVNCGTGAHAIELAREMKGKGSVVATDSSHGRIELARAKAQVKKVTDVEFEEARATSLPFRSDDFDAVIGDASLMRAHQIEPVLSEMLRVARPGGRVILKLTTRGSFGEFFSIYWEALHDAGLIEEVLPELEKLINERSTVSEVEDMAERLGLRDVESFSTKEEFFYETGTDFITSPLIQDSFLSEWLAIVPAERREEVRDRIISLIESERHNAPFDISVKATLIAGVKSSVAAS
ncbi:MAG TPA: class I SAM-dependent methyltransferase [Blastocatellia bacterium]|nr:class I SAM-dependent methyltransferase [Blastocatellia bacterium]